jgi:hypothetical protein
MLLYELPKLMMTGQWQVMLNSLLRRFNRSSFSTYKFHLAMAEYRFSPPSACHQMAPSLRVAQSLATSEVAVLANHTMRE